MTRRIVLSVPARIDLNRHYDYIAQNNPEAALRFFDAARQTFGDLTRMPGIGFYIHQPQSSIKRLTEMAC